MKDNLYETLLKKVKVLVYVLVHPWLNNARRSSSVIGLTTNIL
jgi:hypothetical protein